MMISRLEERRDNYGGIACATVTGILACCYRKWAHRRVDGEHTIFELWVREDRTGWQMHRLDPETREFNCYFKTSTCDPSKVRENWREAFMEVTDVDEW